MKLDTNRKMLNKRKEQKTQKDETGTLVNQSYPISIEHIVTLVPIPLSISNHTNNSFN